MNPIVIDSSVFVDAILYIKNGLLKILDLNAQIFEIAFLFSKKHGLLPNDALIAATCKHYGIRKIATFDPDFDRIDFLEVIAP